MTPFDGREVELCRHNTTNLCAPSTPIWGGGGGREMAKLYSFGAKAVLVSYFLRLKGLGHETEVKFFDKMNSSRSK